MRGWFTSCRPLLRTFALLAAAGAAAPLFAQDQTAVTPQQLDAAYQQLLKNPQDKNLLEQYASTAIRLKNYEAAIPPLESELMTDPDDAELKVRVGWLYLALGSKLMAKQYFEDAQSTPDAPREVIDQAEEYLRGL